MTSYEPTGGDGRYARIYLADVEPRPEDDQPIELPSFEALAIGLDQALAGGQRAEAVAQIRLIRVRARRLAPYWTQGGSGSARDHS